MGDTYNAIREEILKGTLQERMGYDLFTNTINHSWDRLPEKYKEKFKAFIDRESKVVSFLESHGTKVKVISDKISTEFIFEKTLSSESNG